MRISRVKIKNFRNFKNFDITLSEKSTVIVGENNVGKTNFFHALRIVLDGTLPNSARYLTNADFWDGLERPFAGNEIRITVEISDFDSKAMEAATLANCFKSTTTGIVSAISYIYRPKLGKAVIDLTTLVEDDYEYYFCCNEDINRRITDFSFQKFIPFEVLPALRNAGADLESWRRSPLSRLIERLKLDRNDLKVLGDAIDKIIEEILDMPPIATLQGNIDTRLRQMIGQVTSIDPQLGFLQTDPDRLLRFLRLFVDGEKRRSLDEVGTGYANILYLVLLLLDAREKENDFEQASLILAVEEPEAHLHPHLQRLVFSDLFARSSIDLPVMITTHSPHIASVAPLNGILVLKKTDQGTIGSNILGAGLSKTQIKDIERYLNVTRSELVFSSGVILVEGIVEAILVTEFAKKMNKPLDEYGISIIDIDGTDFAPYIKLLGIEGLNIRTAVITDGDPRINGTTVIYDGIERGKNLFKLLYSNNIELVNGLPNDVIRRGLAMEGIFVGQHTIEIDLINAGYKAQYLWIFKELGEGSRSIRNTKEVFRNWETLGFEDQNKKIMNKIENICGKGRFAQRLATKIDAAKIPLYIKDALAYMGIK